MLNYQHSHSLELCCALFARRDEVAVTCMSPWLGRPLKMEPPSVLCATSGWKVSFLPPHLARAPSVMATCSLAGWLFQVLKIWVLGLSLPWSRICLLITTTSCPPSYPVDWYRNVMDPSSSSCVHMAHTSLFTQARQQLFEARVVFLRFQIWR